MTEEEKKAIETLKYLKEDKYILKSLKAKIKAYEDNDDNDECGYVLSQYEQEAIDIVLNLIENMISKDKIKKKIEELNNYYKKEVAPIKYQWGDVDITEFYDRQIDLLEDLLK